MRYDLFFFVEVGLSEGVADSSLLNLGIKF